jgi:Na+/H+ antiporter NhaD/arsenite permease-like protein
MITAILIIFVLAYVLIAAEHAVKIDKAATALIAGVLCWTLLVLAPTGISHEVLEGRLGHHIEEISGILLFLMGAMTIVEIIDAHNGFSIITDRISTTNQVKLLWIISLISFFLSAALDNLTTAIVMVSLARKLISNQKSRWFFAGVIVIAANAGGAWSPIGDVTTTMLWIGGQLTAQSIVADLFLPSLVSLLVPVIVLSFVLKGNLERPESHEVATTDLTRSKQMIVFVLGIGGLLFVPVFKTLTHLPPFMGMMISVGVLWLVTDLMNGRKMDSDKAKYSALSALRKIDMPSVLFFLGILLSVSALQEAGHLTQLSFWLKEQLNNTYAINIAIGVLSAIVDNVPLVAASIGMYPVEAAGTTDFWASHFVQDGTFWHFLAYTAGTGGSMLIIGSAAGVAAMGLEKMSFTWYLKNISFWAMVGFFSGAGVYILMHL